MKMLGGGDMLRGHFNQKLPFNIVVIIHNLPATFKSASNNGIHIKAKIFGYKAQLLQVYMNNKD